MRVALVQNLGYLLWQQKKVILDAHAFLWSNADDSQLPAPARQVIADGDEIYLGAVDCPSI
jgi:PIN domain nuclease of toxin-antitoxin system